MVKHHQAAGRRVTDSGIGFAVGVCHLVVANEQLAHDLDFVWLDRAHVVFQGAIALPGSELAANFMELEYAGAEP
ncbi:hypothetical protein D3C84_1060230 [compost metagenome]